MEKELLKRFLRHYRGLALTVAIASVLLNLLVFAGSLYLLVVYDSVLPSHNVQSLFGLFAILIVVYLFQAVFEAIRSDALLGIATGLHRDLAPRIHHATAARPLRTGRGGGDGMQNLRDIDQVYAFLSGAGPIALIDMPWVIVFLLVLFALHWTLGLAALLCALVLAGIAWTANLRTVSGTHELVKVTGERQARIRSELDFTETAIAMGMRERLLSRSADLDRQFLDTQGALARVVARFGGAGRVFRLFVQSLILTVGALLVIDGKASGGIIIASSVLAGRALAPIDQAIANWRGFQSAFAGWERIVAALGDFPLARQRDVALPVPCKQIALSDVWVVPPGAKSAAVTGVSFKAEAGQAIAVLGPSAAGKTTLAKALLGIWPLARGEIRLDGGTHDQWDAQVLGASFGYVSQNVDLIAGTIGENIARFDPAASSEDIVAAARAAGMHEAILAFPNGYETPISHGGSELSGGQRQRIGLARALYGDPFILVLDEPNSNLDAEGDEALSAAITAVRARGGIVIMITHRPATLGSISHVAILNNGRLTDFGERDEVLKRSLKSRAGTGPRAA